MTSWHLQKYWSSISNPATVFSPHCTLSDAARSCGCRSWSQPWRVARHGKWGRWDCWDPPPGSPHSWCHPGRTGQSSACGPSLHRTAAWRWGKLLKLRGRHPDNYLRTDQWNIQSGSLTVNSTSVNGKGIFVVLSPRTIWWIWFMKLWVHTCGAAAVVKGKIRNVENIKAWILSHGVAVTCSSGAEFSHRSLSLHGVVKKNPQHYCTDVHISMCSLFVVAAAATLLLRHNCSASTLKSHTKEKNIHLLSKFKCLKWLSLMCW